MKITLEKAKVSFDKEGRLNVEFDLKKENFPSRLIALVCVEDVFSKLVQGIVIPNPNDFSKGEIQMGIALSRIKLFRNRLTISDIIESDIEKYQNATIKLLKASCAEGKRIFNDLLLREQHEVEERQQKKIRAQEIEDKINENL